MGHGGVEDGLMRHLVSGTTVEQPVPRKMSDDDAASPAGGSIAGPTDSLLEFCFGFFFYYFFLEKGFSPLHPTGYIGH